MRFTPVPPHKQFKERGDSLRHAPEHIEIDILLRETERALRGNAMVSGQRIRAAAQLRRHLELRITAE